MLRCRFLVSVSERLEVWREREIGWSSELHCFWTPPWVWTPPCGLDTALGSGHRPGFWTPPEE